MIGVTIALAAPQVEVFATDINPAAVELARENAARHGVADRVHVFEGDLLDPVPEPVLVVVANLPYLPEAEHDDAYDDEPPDAIYAPGDGLGPLRQLLEHLRGAASSPCRASRSSSTAARCSRPTASTCPSCAPSSTHARRARAAA